MGLGLGLGLGLGVRVWVRVRVRARVEVRVRGRVRAARHLVDVWRRRRCVLRRAALLGRRSRSARLVACELRVAVQVRVRVKG